VSQVGIADLLEAGVHFGHQTRRWNPKMRRFIHGERNGIYIIDLLKTAVLLQQAQEVAAQIAHRGGTVLFVGTKKQARDAIKEVAEAADMPYVNNRWLGGLLTNFQTINQRIRRLHDLERYEIEGQLALLPTRERMAAQADLAKLRANLGGVKNMQRTPNAIFVIDLKTEAIAVREAQRLRIPVIGLVDTNCDPDGIDYVIPGNDDAMRSCALIAKAIGDVVAQGHAVFRAEEEKARLQRAEQVRREAEERARREAEEQAKREADEAVAKEAAEKQAAAAAAQAAAAASAEPAPAPATPAPAQASTAAAQASTAPAQAAPSGQAPPTPEPVVSTPKPTAPPTPGLVVSTPKPTAPPTPEPVVSTPKPMAPPTPIADAPVEVESSVESPSASASEDSSEPPTETTRAPTATQQSPAVTQESSAETAQESPTATQEPSAETAQESPAETAEEASAS
jgi:small subunit ribosomal protein S2